MGTIDWIKGFFMKFTLKCKPDLKEKLNSSAKILFFIYIVIQPLLDTIYLFDERVVAFFGISPSTIIRFLMIAVIAVIVFWANGFTKKFRILLTYGIIVIIYFAFHCLNARNFNTVNPMLSGFSITNEVSYILRFIVPALVVYIASSIGISKSFFEKAITILSATMSGLIVITNIFCISLDSYTNERIKFNIFVWFTDAYRSDSFNGLASKAFFNFANMVSVIFCMLLPLIIYFAVHKSKAYFGLAFLHSVAMLMLGTKTSTYGVFLILTACVFIYIFLLITKQEKSSGKQTSTNFAAMGVICVMIIGVILPVSPAIYRNNISSDYMQHYDELKKDDKDDKDDDIPDEEYSEEQLLLKKKLSDSGIMSRFYIKCYNFVYDMDFWEDMTKFDSAKRLDSRFIEKSMLDRVKELNNNSLDNWLGITYDRTSRIYNLEQDTLYQYYSLGIIGVIVFIAPYFAILVYGIFICLRHFKQLCNFENICVLFGIALTLATGFYCGNTIDNPFANILLSFICAYSVIFIRPDRSKSEIK